MSETTAVNECCGWPEIGVCPGCPDPETVAWGKLNENKLREHIEAGYIPICGSALSTAEISRITGSSEIPS